MTSDKVKESDAKRKIGFFVSLIYLKDDVRRLISDLSRQHAVVLFVLDVHDEKDVSAPANVEVRFIKQNPSPKDRVLKSFFSICGKIPKSRENYYLMEAFKAQSQKKQNSRTRLILWLDAVCPKVLSYDRYLDLLDERPVCDLQDISSAIFFTNVCCDWALKQVLSEKIDTTCYVYSWDHATKHKKFSKRTKYAVWCEDIETDLYELQDIERSQIAVLGASQFSLIDAYFQMEKQVRHSAIDTPFFYFGCAVGIPSLVAEEVEIIKIIAQAIEVTAPSYKLLVRPYPVLDDWSHYSELRNIPNIVIESVFTEADELIYKKGFVKKYHTLEKAKGFFHCGTTLGLEAAFFDTPSFLVDLSLPNDKAVSMYNFVNQYQNVKYLKQINEENVIGSVEKLNFVLVSLLEKRENFLSYNRELRQIFQIESFDGIKNKLIARMSL